MGKKPAAQIPPFAAGKTNCLNIVNCFSSKKPERKIVFLDILCKLLG